jgi:cell pole-organizing protein PopZ
MSENAQEPTMEEILASIRRIISEDEPTAEAESELADAPAPVMAVADPLPEEPAAVDDDILELTDRIDEPMDEEVPLDIGDLEVVHAAPEPEPAPSPAPRAYEPPPYEPPVRADEPLLGAPASSSAASAFGALERSVLMPAGGRTLEDVVREMLRPMLKTWLDENLPAIVEAQVSAEVERIARQRR